MKNNEYHMAVTDEDKKTSMYKVEIMKDSVHENSYSPRKRKLIFFYIMFFSFCGLMGTSFFVKCSPSKNEVKNESVFEVSADTVDIKKNNSVLKKSDNYIPLVCMTIFCTVGITLLFVLYIIDDNGIKFAKLNELHSLRINTLNQIADLNNVQDYEIIEEKTSKDNSKKSNSKTTTKKKIFSAEYIKNYMNSIAEI